MIEVNATRALLTASLDAVAASYEGRKHLPRGQTAEFAKLCRAAQWSDGSKPVKATITVEIDSEHRKRKGRITITLEEPS